MKGRFPMLLVGLAAGVLLGYGLLWGYGFLTGQRGVEKPVSVLEVGAPAPDFVLNKLDGKEDSLSQYRGRAVVLNFWATWCAPCKKEMPLFESVYREHAGKLVVIGVNVREGSDVAKPFVNETGISFPILMDPTGSAVSAYRVSGYPTTFFIDSEGILRAAHIGEINPEMIGRYLEAVGIEL